MKAISTNDLVQVSGGFNPCLISVFDAVSNTSHCLLKVTGEIPAFELPMEYAIPLAFMAFGAKMAYDMYTENNKNPMKINFVESLQLEQVGN